ncbi:hypothetical protein V7S43_018302 [Phytophthora oleae]|uniref:Uncharacterized protein n=1 Tax=Phytophthora oleae TaxID=2107226 RepID=A0ABD3EUZ7_9STRA
MHTGRPANSTDGSSLVQLVDSAGRRVHQHVLASEIETLGYRNTIDFSSTRDSRNNGGSAKYTDAAPPDLQREYEWFITSDAIVTGVPERQTSGALVLVLMDDGIHWRLQEAADFSEATHVDVDSIRGLQQGNGIAFSAQPHAHRFPWSVADAVANKHVVKAIKRQLFKRYKAHPGKELEPVLARLEQAVVSDRWQQRVMHQTPLQLWAHKNTLMDYQIWVNYRLAARQLNLYFDGRQISNADLPFQQRLPQAHGQRPDQGNADAHILGMPLCTSRLARGSER